MNPPEERKISITFTVPQIKHLVDVLCNNFAIVDLPPDTSRSTINDVVLGKTLNACAEAEEHWEKMQKTWRNEFKQNLDEFATNPLFMGAGNYSANRSSMLHRRLKAATWTLGGMQQNGGMGTEFDDKADQQDERAIKQILRDIIAAFRLKPSDLLEVS